MKKRIALILGIGAFTFSIAGYGISRSAASVKEPEVSRAVSVAIAERSDLSRNVNLVAELTPYQEINIYAKVAGYMQDISVDIGDQVKAGQVIATLELPEQKAQLAQARADLEKAQLDYERLDGVAKKRPGLVAKQELDDTRANYDAAKAKMQYAETIYGYAKIIAPFDGVITKRLADPGALIQAGVSSNTQTLPVVHLAENTKLRLSFPVQESLVPLINTGAPVDITIEANGEKITSKIARISDKLDTATRTMEAQVDIDNSNLHLKPGMYADVNIALEKREGTICIPIQALSGKDNPTVMVINKDNKVEERKVKVGLETPDKAEILEGLNEGEKVVFGSRSGLNPGLKVAPQIASN